MSDIPDPVIKEQEKEQSYYSSLQAALISFDTKLWQILALYTGVVTLMATGFNFDHLFSIKNLAILFFGSLFLLLLILFHNKARFFHISIQKKINEFDAIDATQRRIKRIPLASMSAVEIDARINDLDRGRSMDRPFSPFQKFLIKRSVNDWLKIIMWLTLGISILVFLFIFNYKLIKFINDNFERRIKLDNYGHNRISNHPIFRYDNDIVVPFRDEINRK